MTATSVSLLLAVSLLASASSNYPNNSMQLYYCNPGDMNKITPVVSGQSIFNFIYQAIWFAPESPDMPGGSKYAATATIIFSILMFFGALCWVIMISVSCFSKLFFCVGRVPDKKRRTGCEKISELILLGGITALAATSLIYSLYSKDEGTASVCSMYNLFDNWDYGDNSTFDGIEKTFINYSFITQSMYYMIYYYRYNLTSLQYALNYDINSTYTSIYNLSVAQFPPVSSPSSLDVNIIPRTLQKIGPINTPDTWTYILMHNYSGLVTDYQNNVSVIVNYYNLSLLTSYYESINNQMENFNHLLIAEEMYGNIKYYADYMNDNLIIDSSLIFALVVCIAISYGISIFVSYKCFPIIHIHLMMVGTMICFYVGAVSLIDGANYSQMCNVMNQAIYHKDTDAMDNILNWFGINETSLSRSALFGVDISFYDALTQGIDFYGLENNLQSMIYYSSQTEDEYYNLMRNVDAYSSILSFYFTQLSLNGYLPIDEALPDSRNAITRLNALTESSTPGCEIHDKWSYTYENCGNYPIQFMNDTYFNSHIGTNVSCLSLFYINETSFKYRYNSSFVSKCDPTGKIFAAYASLSAYSDSIFYSFANVSIYINNVYINWYSILNASYEIETSLYPIKYFANDTLTTVYRFLNGKFNTNIIQSDLLNLRGSICRWGNAISTLSFTVTLMGILSIFFALLRTNYLRFLKQKEVQSTGFIELLPNQLLMPQPNQPQQYIPQAPVVQNYTPNFNAVEVKM